VTQSVRVQGDSGSHVSGGTALEVMESVTPVMAVTTAIMTCLFEPVVDSLQNSVYFSSLGHLGITTGLVLVSTLLAFFMVWVEFELIASTSALTFIVAGVFKEIVTVLVAHYTFGDRFTVLNGIGLGVLMSGVCLYNYQKYQKIQADAGRPSVRLHKGIASGGDRGSGEDVRGDDAIELLESGENGLRRLDSLDGDFSAELMDGTGRAHGHSLLDMAGKRAARSPHLGVGVPFEERV
jgi:hypothetical protein